MIIESIVFLLCIKRLISFNVVNTIVVELGRTLGGILSSFHCSSCKKQNIACV